MAREKLEVPLLPEMRTAALALYKGPFRYSRGYIYDAGGEMVLDDGGVEDRIVRVRGWGRISYLPTPELLQDAVGVLIAEALTKFWQESQAPRVEQVPERAIIELSDRTVAYDSGDKIHYRIFRRVMEFFKTHGVYTGEAICQMDSPIIDAPNVLADIADDILKMNTEWKED